MTKQIAVFFLLFTLCLSFTGIKAQQFIKDSALVVMLYSVDMQNSKSDTYVADVYYLIRFYGANNNRKELEEILQNTRRKRNNTSDILKELNSKDWLSFLNKMPSTSFNVQNLLNKGLREKLIEYDSVHRYATGCGINTVSSLSKNSYMKVYKVYCGGYIDTISYTKLKAIYHGPDKSFLTYHTTADILRKDKGTNKTEALTIPVTLELKINQRIQSPKTVRFFIETDGKVIKEFAPIQLK